MERQLIKVRKEYKELYYKKHFELIKDQSESNLDKSQNSSSSLTEGDLSIHKRHSENKNESGKFKFKKINKKSILILGDSSLNGIEESKLPKTRHIRVQPIPGAKIDDVYKNLGDVLHHDLTKLILHVGVNNTNTDTAEDIFKNLMSLKQEIEKYLPNCDVIISNMIKRTDNPDAQRISESVNKQIKASNMKYIENDNINEKHLGKRGLHLNPNGNAKFAANLLNAIRS